MEEKRLKFEEALQQLEAIIQAIEQGRVGLEESIDKYEQGMRLIRYCRELLAQAEARSEQLRLSERGELEPGPMQPPSTGDAVPPESEGAEG